MHPRNVNQPHAAGDDLAVRGGKATLMVKVQCPNWFDIDRVQVFLNGRPEDALNFTRRSTPGRFSDATTKFEQEIPIRLEKDTHVIVAVIGEQSKLGPVMGPEHSADRPVAVSNPIFVDVDGGGFKANGDQCTRIVCAEGSFLNDDNECEKRREKKPVATRDRPEGRQPIVRRSQAPISAPGPSTTATGRPLTGTERVLGCYSNEAIMSGKCP